MSRLPGLTCAALLLLLVSSLSLSEAASHDWDYETRGPGSWPTLFKAYCAGKSQSPVDISASVNNPTLTEFSMNTETRASEYELTIENDGHKLQVAFGSTLAIRMGSGGSPQYTAAQIHWHWGGVNNRGSEHTITGRSYPMEGHLVFWNSRDYADFNTAKKSPNGLAVLGVFYELSTVDNPLFSAIERYLPQVVTGGSKVTYSFRASQLNFLDAFLPKAPRHFYRYQGSLTTPNCSENVLWTVYARPVPISARQLSLLRSLRYSSGRPEVDNYRPAQPLNGRVIQRNF